MGYRLSIIFRSGVLTLAALLALGACGRPPASLEAPQDGSVAPGPDAAPDAGPLRRLVARRLFGTTPVENGVVDPTFSTVDYSSWSPYSYMTNQNALVTPLHLPTPTGLPALRVIRTGSQASVAGLVRSAAGPVEVSLWCGWPVDEPDPEPRLSLLGFFAPGQGAADFTPDPATAPVTLGEITWTRYVATLTAGPMGWATLRIVHRAEPPLYLNAPALVPLAAGARKGGAAARRPARVRPLTPVERLHLRGIFEPFRDRFGGPPGPAFR